MQESDYSWCSTPGWWVGYNYQSRHNETKTSFSRASEFSATIITLSRWVNCFLPKWMSTQLISKFLQLMDIGLVCSSRHKAPHMLGCPQFLDSSWADERERTMVILSSEIMYIYISEKEGEKKLENFCSAGRPSLSGLTVCHRRVFGRLRHSAGKSHKVWDGTR